MKAFLRNGCIFLVVFVAGLCTILVAYSAWNAVNTVGDAIKGER